MSPFLKVRLCIMSEFTENTNIAYLNGTLKEIRNLELLKSRTFNQQDLESLDRLLNGALPKTEMDKGQARLIRFMSNKSTPPKIAEFLNDIGAPGLILWTDSKTIIARLRLSKLIYLQWSKDDGKYKVKQYLSKVDSPQTAGNWGLTLPSQTLLSHPQVSQPSVSPWSFLPGVPSNSAPLAPQAPSALPG